MADFASILSGAGGLLSGIGSASQIFGNLFGGNDYYRQSQDAFNKQKQLMNLNNEFQSAENIKSRNFTKQMYEKQWQDYQDYNDYSAMVRRAVNAGVSPSALFQSGAPAQFGGLSPASVGHTASPSPSYEGIVNPVNRQAESFHSISSGLSALASATKMGAETSQIVPLMSAEIQNQLSQAGFNDIRSKSADFEFGLRQIYGKKLYDSELGLNFAKAVDLYSSSYLHAQEGKTQDSVRELNLANRLLKDTQRESTNKEIQMFDLQISWYPKEMSAKINNLNAQSEESKASASNLSASTEQTKLFNKIYSDKRYQHSIISQAVTAGQQAIDQNKLTRQQVQHMNYMIEQAAYANDLKEFTYWSNQIQGYVHSVGEAASSFYGAGALRELVKMRQMSRIPPTTVIGFN